MISEYISLELPEYSTIIEEEDGVVYAYLLKSNEFVGDVWLCNRGETPTENEWETGEDMPFKNFAKYIKVEVIDIVDIEE